jgi:inorganic pyrophosphatase
MSDEKGRDSKLLGVPATDPRWASVDDIGDLPDFLLEEIRHFFEVYKQIEPGKETVVGGWQGAEVAAAEVDRARERAAPH